MTAAPNRPTLSERKACLNVAATPGREHRIAVSITWASRNREVNPMLRFAEFCLRHPRWIGALYCIVPAVAWLVGAICLVPFREVYLLRVALSVVIGGSVAAWLHEYGVKLWLAKHRCTEGPAGVLDGAMIGAAVGWGIQLLPPLTSLIATNHPEEAKTAIIAIWLISAAIGALVGAALASVWVLNASTPRQDAEAASASSQTEPSSTMGD